MNWISKAQERLQKHADQVFAAWCESKAGQNWRNHWANKPPAKRRNIRMYGRIAANSPYAHGFQLPDYHYDLIDAVGSGDEAAAKAIMLTHYI